jgi:hypothetical protein
MGDSSEEYWTMDDSLIQLSRVSDEGYFDCKALSASAMHTHAEILT